MWPNRVKVAISSIFSYIFFPTYFSPTLFCWPSLHEIYGDIFAVKLSRNFPRNWIPEGWSLEVRMADDVFFENGSVFVKRWRWSFPDCLNFIFYYIYFIFLTTFDVFENVLLYYPVDTLFSSTDYSFQFSFCLLKAL